MKVTLYADILFLMNFSMDFISIWASSLIGNRPRRVLRMTAAASIGALYGVVSVILGVGGALSWIFSAAVSILMSITAFGVGGGVRSIFRQSALIWICGALLGGVMSAAVSLAGGSTLVTAERAGGGSLLPVIAAGSAICLILAVRLIRRVKRARSVDVCVMFRGAKSSFEALCDSGNLLRDPISGDPVMTVSRHAVMPLCGSRGVDALVSFDTEALCELSLPFRVIPRRTVDASSLVCALVPDKVYITSGGQRREVRCLIAPADCARDSFGGYCATVPVDII